MLSMAFRVHACACINFCLCEKGFKIKDSIPKLVCDYMSGKIMVDEFITHKMDLEQVNDAVKLMRTGQWYLSHFFLYLKFIL